MTTYTRKFCPTCGWPASGQSCEHCGTNLVVQLGDVDRGHTVIDDEKANRRMMAGETRRRIITLIVAILSTLALIGLFLAGSSLAPAAFVLALIFWVYFFALVDTRVI